MNKEEEFVEEVIKLSKKYNLAIAHEDKYGRFEIVKYSEEECDNLRNRY